MLIVIGCGNPNRRDDGAGVLVAQRLEAALAPHERRHVTVIDAGTDGMAVLMQAGAAITGDAAEADGSTPDASAGGPAGAAHAAGSARAAGALIIVDASRTGSDPGAIHQVPGAELESLPPPSFNLHDFRWDHALYAGRRMYGDDFPRDVEVFLIEAQDLSLGIGLTPRVASAVERVTDAIRERIAAAAPAAPSGVAGDRQTEATLTLARGSLRLPQAVWERHFAGLDSVLMLPRGESLLILPVQPGGGGQLVKVINRAGDRAVSGVELFRAQGLDGEHIDGDRQASYAARWSEADAALVIDRFFC